jgi:hypothetical protein
VARDRFPAGITHLSLAHSVHAAFGHPNSHILRTRRSFPGTKRRKPFASAGNRTPNPQLLRFQPVALPTDICGLLQIFLSAYIFLQCGLLTDLQPSFVSVDNCPLRNGVGRQSCYKLNEDVTSMLGSPILVG